MRLLKKQNTNQTSVNGRGIQYSADQLATIESTSALILPKGDTSERPGSVGMVAAQEGMVRYNNTENYFEVYEVDATLGTPQWVRFRTDTPKPVTHQLVGTGDDVEIIFGPLNSGDPLLIEPYALRPEQILVFVEGYYQRPNSSPGYTLAQNPCRAISNYIDDFLADGQIIDTQFNGKSIIVANSNYVDFEALGFYADQTIVVSGSASNDGVYTVESVSAPIVGQSVLAVNETFLDESNVGNADVINVDGFQNSTVAAGTVSATAVAGNLITLAITPPGALSAGEEIIFDANLGALIANKRYIVNSVALPNITVRTLEKGVATATFPPVTLAVTATAGSGSVATLTFATQSLAPFFVGQTIAVAGITPVGYNNASAVVTACNTTTVSYANATTGSIVTSGTVSSADNEILVNTSAGLQAGMQIEFAGAYAYNIGTVSQVNSTGNVITVDDTGGLQIGMSIVFAGNQLGNLVAGTTYYILTVTPSYSITISATLGGSAFDPGTAVGTLFFTASGSMMGNIQANTEYYVLSTPTATSVVISATSGGPQYGITRDTGYVVYESTQVGALTMTNASGSINFTSGALYNNSAGSNTYIKIGDANGNGPVPAGIDVTVVHNFDK